MSENRLPPQSPPSIKPQQPQQWYHVVTLDVLVRIVSRSIFHPAIVLIFYLCLAAIHKHKTAVAYYTLYYAAFLCGLEMASAASHRIAYGKPRKVEWEKEVVVVTGGATGLGRLIVESLVRRGVRVGVLDVKEADVEARELMEGGGGELLWQVCDVGDEKAVEHTVGKIVEELGPPSIIINNAATPINARPLIPITADKVTSNTLTLNPSAAFHTLQTNTLSHFNLLTATLPYLTSAKQNPQGATVITISSILAHLSPSHLSDYAASKAAVSSLHHSLVNELHAHPSQHVRSNVKTLLVEPGQMDTALFLPHTTLPWYANFFGPVLDAKDVANEIIRVVGNGEAGVLRMPFYARCVGWGLLGMVPEGIMRGVRIWTGIDGAVRK